MPIVNFIYELIKRTVETAIIDVPDLTKEQKISILKATAKYGKEIVTDSIAKTMSDEISKAR